MNQIEPDEKTHPAGPTGRPHRTDDAHAQPSASSKRDHPAKAVGAFLGLQRASADGRPLQQQTAKQDPAAVGRSETKNGDRKAGPERADGRDAGLAPPSPQRGESDAATDAGDTTSTDRFARIRLVDRQRDDRMDANRSFIKSDVDAAGTPDHSAAEASPPGRAVKEQHGDTLPSPSKQDAIAADLLQALSNRYLIAEGKYFFRERQQILAFEDSGKRIATVHDDPNVARSMVDLAEAKGWDSIKLRGSDEFKREAWLAATLRGMEVRGFRPKDNDKARLADMLADAHDDKPNVIEKAEAQSRDLSDATPDRQEESVNHGSPAQQPPRLGKRHQQELQMLKTLLRDRGDSETAIEMTADIASEQLMKNRNYVGKLLDHGAAHYEHKENEQPSYFVVLDTPRGEKTIWGVDLQRAMEEAQIERGADIVLSQVGKQHVTVPKVERANDGRIVGDKEWVPATRNDWEVTTVDSMRDLAAARAVVASLDRISSQQPEKPVPDPARPPAPARTPPRAPGLMDREPDYPMR